MIGAMLSRLTPRRRVRAGTRDAGLLPEARLSGPLPWVMAIMITLTVVAAASGLALRRTLAVARAELAGGVTVQIVTAAASERDRQADLALTILRRQPGVASARRVGQDELDALVEPWLGALPDNDAGALPLPAMIDVRLHGPSDPGRLAALRASLGRTVPAARLNAEADWLTPAFRALGALQWLAVGLIVLLGCATTAAVMLAARNALGSQHETIEIVHMLGGTDRQIARVFQRGAALDATIGGVIGLALGALALTALARPFAALGSGLAASDAGWLGWQDMALIALIPLAGVALAILTARLTVLAALRRML